MKVLVTVIRLDGTKIELGTVDVKYLPTIMAMYGYECSLMVQPAPIIVDGVQLSLH